MTDAEDRKPQSDEARSAFVSPSHLAAPTDSESSTTSEFAVPDGLAVPKPGSSESETTSSSFALPDGLDVAPPPPHEPEGSAFSTPRTYSAKQAAAFTPPTGVPLVRLTKDVPWQDRMRTMLRMPVTERPAPEPVQRHDEAGPAVPRVLDLSLRIGELLLAGGGGRRGRGGGDVRRVPLLRPGPLRAQRHLHPARRLLPAVPGRRPGDRLPHGAPPLPDYTRLAAVYQLVDDLSDAETQVTLEEAYRRLAEIRRNRHPYPGWALTAASGLLVYSASVLVGGQLLVFVAAAVGAMLGDRLAWLCAGRGLPEFYQFTVAATPPTAIGVALTLAHADVKASAVITGGLFALLPGRALVAGVQDGLTGFYITASARLLEVLYFFVGIVIGVLTVLYFGVQLGANLVPDAALGRSDPQPVLQTAASLGLSLAFAVLLQQERATVLMVTLNGGVAWVVYGAMHDTGGISPVASTAVAAGVVGLFGQLLARYRFASALPYTTAAIGPLLPGSATYFGLLGIAQNEVDSGLTSLTKAVALAMAIAIGVNLGSEISRLFLRIGSAEKRRAAKRTRGF